MDGIAYIKVAVSLANHHNTHLLHAEYPVGFSRQLCACNVVLDRLHEGEAVVNI